MNKSRRSFLKSAQAIAAANTLAPLFSLLELPAIAQQGLRSEYKAIVYIFLYGGNDANNLLVPLDSSRYAKYAASRGVLALPQASLLELQNTDFAVHPGMPGLAQLFSQGSAAFLANAGPLVQPTNVAQYRDGSAMLPENLLSHPDQQNEMQNALAVSEGSQGWGGRIADSMSAYGSATIPLSISVTGTQSAFINGVNSSGFVAPSGNAGFSCGMTANCGNRSVAAKALLAIQSGSALVQSDQALTSQMYSYADAYSAAMRSGTALKTAFPSKNGLASQLKQIAQIIQVRSSFGAQRQIFFAGLGSFDHHANQLVQQAALLTQVDAALSSFWSATQELGLSDSVTIVTGSDFGRTMRANGSAGSDHAWGAHHFVVGGTVKGGTIYGTYPDPTLNGLDDLDGNGRFVPSISISQIGATLAKWFDVSASDMAKIFPLLGNFPQQDIGFLAP